MLLLFFLLLNMKQKCFDRKNCRALENKVNHCRRMPEVDKWGDRNVSTTSAVCFLCWEFFILCLHCSFSYFPALPVTSLLTMLSSLHCILLMYTFSFPFYHWVSPQLGFHNKILFVRCHGSRKAVRELTKCHYKQNHRLI